MASLPKAKQAVAIPQVGIVPLLRRAGSHFLLRRLLRAFFTIFFVASCTFFLVRLMPGNPVDVYVDAQVTQGVPRELAEAQAASLFSIDLDAPIWRQYLDYLGQMAHGDMGPSVIRQGTSVSEIILQFLPWTLFSVGLGLMISFIAGVLLGIFAAYKRGTWIDHVLTNLFAIIQAVPNYLLAVVLLVLIGIRYPIVDIGAMRGTLSPGVKAGFSLGFIRDALYHASLPILVYVLTSIGSWMLAMRASTESTLNEDYVGAGLARGIKPARIAVGYVGRNAILPLFTQLMIAIGFSVGGSLLIENIFAYNGIGMALSQAIIQRDYTLIQGILLVITTSVVLINLVADLVYARLDPRLRIGGA
jgi:peptide/nickel transport system permease protein